MPKCHAKLLCALLRCFVHDGHNRLKVLRLERKDRMHRIALVGTGYWGPNVARSLELSGRAKVVWLCDTDETRLRTMAEKWPDAKITTRLSDLLPDQELGAVAVSTPVNTHFEIGKASLLAGKHVLLEKPMTSMTAQSEELVRIAAQQRRILMVGHVFQYNASIIALKELVDSGELGNLYYMHFERTNLGPVRTDVNALWDLATHDISIMCFLMNEMPRDVSARGGAYLNPGLEDVVFASFTFRDNVIAHVHASWLNPRKIRQITVVGDRKMAVWDDLDQKVPIRIYDKRIAQQKVDVSPLADTYFAYKTEVVDGGLAQPVVQLNQPLAAECDHFLDCIEGKGMPLSDGMNGLRVVKILEATTLSLRSQSAITPIEA